MHAFMIVAPRLRGPAVVTLKAEGTMFYCELPSDATSGMFVSEDKGQYIGEFVGERFQGRGLRLLPDQSIHAGMWEGSRAHGIGASLDSKGVSYRGEWVKGSRHGLGRLAEPSGDVYLGQFKDNRKHGIGRLVLASGQARDATWSKDVETGVATGLSDIITNIDKGDFIELQQYAPLTSMLPTFQCS